MQELLGRIARLDPSASLGLRVIACFDELMIGNVNTRALLAAAASLAGCVAGFTQERPPRSMRVTPRGLLAEDVAPRAQRTEASASEGLLVWLERDGDPMPNDAIILERLALALRIRHGRGRGPSDTRRDLGVLVDETVGKDERCLAGSTLGLVPGQLYRAVAAPLFAVWSHHPAGPEDVVPTSLGPIHALVVPAGTAAVDATPCGVGVAVPVEQLHHSFRTAMVSLRLCDATHPTVAADEYGGLIGLLADAPDDSPQPDAARLEEVARHPWGIATVDAVVRSASVRQAARLAEVHHSTLQTRLECITEVLGFDPYDGFGRARLGTAYLVWRLRHSHALELPAPRPQSTSASSSSSSSVSLDGGSTLAAADQPSR